MAETNGARDARLSRVHERAMGRFDACYTSQKDIRQQCVRDRRFAFVPGAQFEGDLEEQFANRPRFEVNKLQDAITRIFSEYRNNRITVDFRPDDKATSDDEADFCDGLYRADEQESNAQEAYDTAFEEGVAGGMGAWRLYNRYADEDDPDADEDDDRRRIGMEPIPDADNSVYFDINAKTYDKRTATYCFVVKGHQPDEYADEFGFDPQGEGAEWKKAKNITSFNKVERLAAFDWFTPDIVYVSEYYEVEQVDDPVHVYRQVASGEEVKVRPKRLEKDALAAKLDELEAQGFTLARVKKMSRRAVHKYIVDGNKVLEDCGIIAGKCIPIVPFYAKRNFIDNIERIQGHIRLAIDAQRLYNMVISMLAELTTYPWAEKPILTPEQVLGHEDMWALDPVKRFAYLHINPTVDAQTGNRLPAADIPYTKVPNLPPALVALLQLIGVDIKEVLGQSQTGQEVVSNISAKAVELIQNRLDMQNFIYMDNLKKSMRRCGEVWLSMSRDLYVEDERPMRLVKEDMTDEMSVLREPALGKDGAQTYKNDPGAGKFKVVADVGPSFTTRRDGTVRAITGMLQFVEDPMEKGILTAIAMKNLEGEGLEPAKKMYRNKLLAAGLEEPTDDEREEMEAAQANQKPDAQTEFLQAEAEKALALANKANADAQASLALVKEREASAAEKIAKIEALPLDQILRLVDSLNAQTPAANDEPPPPEPMAA